MLKRMIDIAKLKWRNSIQEEYDRQTEVRSQIRIGRTVDGTVFEIVVAILNLVLWGLAIYFRNEDIIVWIAAAIGTFTSVAFCNIAYDPAMMADFDLPKNKRQPVHFLLASRFNRLSALFCVLMGISTQLTFFDKSYSSISIILLVLGCLGFLVFRLLLWLK